MPLSVPFVWRPMSCYNSGMTEEPTNADVFALLGWAARDWELQALSAYRTMWLLLDPSVFTREAGLAGEITE